MEVLYFVFLVLGDGELEKGASVRAGTRGDHEYKRKHFNTRFLRMYWCFQGLNFFSGSSMVVNVSYILPT